MAKEDMIQVLLDQKQIVDNACKAGELSFIEAMEFHMTLDIQLQLLDQL